MIVYMDGGSQRVQQTKRQNDWVLSWGIVAHKGDETVELHGSFKEVNSQFHGYHEMAAFAETVKYLKREGVPYEDVSFFTDDQWVVEAANEFQPCYPDRMVDANFGFRERLMKFVNEFYPATMYDDMLECLQKGRFTKVKGHDNTVYNLRVDYLAVHARNLCQGVKEEFLQFEQWLAKGFKFFNTEKHEYDVWYAPFAS